MVCVPWLLVVVMAYVCTPGFGAMCWDSSICSDLSSKDRLLDCIHLCTSVLQAEIPALSSLALESNEEDLLLGILLATLGSREQIPEPNPESRSVERRSYDMEHFRWGKPNGRKRRPVKVFDSFLEGEDFSEGSFPPQERRQLSTTEDEAREDTDLQSNPNQGLEGMTFSPKPNSPMKEKKDGTYQMNHFRWGSPPTTKRYGNFMKQGRSQGPLVRLFRNVIKDAQ